MEKNKVKLVQLSHKQARYIALVAEPQLLIIAQFDSIYELALCAIANKTKLTQLIDDHLTTTALNYDDVYLGNSEWKLLPAFDHPSQPSACLVSGTGLTHKNSALNRQMMHQGEQKLTDSMVMYQWGVDGGSPKEDEIGVQPEWFFKGHGDVLKAHGQHISVPIYGDDGGEEPEIAGVYLIGPEGQPYRIGFTTGNEFSDHVMEKKNYLYLAPSKLRECAIGPELVITDDFHSFTGTVAIERDGQNIWQANVKSGESNMAHNLANLEHHHFKYEAHRIPLQAHVHFMGADAFSFGSKIVLKDGDLMKVHWQELGRPLKNHISIAPKNEQLITVKALT